MGTLSLARAETFSHRNLRDADRASSLRYYAITTRRGAGMRGADDAGD